MVPAFDMQYMVECPFQGFLPYYGLSGPQTHQLVLGDGQGAGAYAKSKLLLLVRYCYEVEEQAGERAEDERRRADTCVAAALAWRVLDL